MPPIVKGASKALVRNPFPGNKERMKFRKALRY